jgi:hypothetical protein
MRVSIIDDVFQPIYGKPSWQVKQGYGSFLTFEFGEPRLHITEQRQASKEASEKLRKRWARRHVFIHGERHLWIYICDWRVFHQGQALANSESTRKVIRNALLELDGQALTSVTVNKSYVSIFEFDLGGRLEVSPNYEGFEKTDDLWLLYEPSGNVFTLRADGKYKRAPGDGSGKHQWKALTISKPKLAVK